MQLRYKNSFSESIVPALSHSSHADTVGSVYTEIIMPPQDTSERLLDFNNNTPASRSKAEIVTDPSEFRDDFTKSWRKMVLEPCVRVKLCMN